MANTMNNHPPPRPTTLDFSQFHPLDHWPWEPRCQSLPGGRRRHLQLAWEHKDRHWSRIRRRSLCRLGHHRITHAWKRKGSPHEWEWEPIRCCTDCRWEP